MARPRCPASAVTPFGMRSAPSLNKSMEARSRLPLLLRSCVCSRKRMMTLVPPPQRGCRRAFSLPHERSWYNDNVGDGGGQTPLRKTPGSGARNRLPGSLISRGEGDKSEARRQGRHQDGAGTDPGRRDHFRGRLLLPPERQARGLRREASIRPASAGRGLVATAGHVVYAPDGATGTSRAPPA